jgi:hypothetical protein
LKGDALAEIGGGSVGVPALAPAGGCKGVDVAVDMTKGKAMVLQLQASRMNEMKTTGSMALGFIKKDLRGCSIDF